MPSNTCLSAKVLQHHPATTAQQTSWAFLEGKKHQVFSPAAADKT
jgi:hypothetical protein